MQVVWRRHIDKVYFFVRKKLFKISINLSDSVIIAAVSNILIIFFFSLIPPGFHYRLVFRYLPLLLS